MSNQHIDPSDNSGATRNLNNHVAKQVVKQALLLYPKTSPNDNEPIEAPVTQEAESLLISSTKASAPESDEVPLPPRQYSGEAQLMAAILEWQRDLRKELEADNQATEYPPAGSDSNHMAKLVATHAVGLHPEPSTKEDEQTEPAPSLEAEPLLTSSMAAPAPELEEAALPPAPTPLLQLPAPTLPLPPGVKRGLPTHTSQDFRHLPRHVWLVRDVFHGGEVIILWGESQAGKTALLLDMVAAIASGSDWAGHPVTRTNVIYVALEGQIGVRTRLRGRIESVIDWAIARGYRTDSNPARWKGLLDKLLPAPGKVTKTMHFQALPYAQLPVFMEQLVGQDGMGAKALLFLILTAARSGEVRGATWDEIDLAARVWTIPAERMKASKAHRVPLSDAAIALLQEMKALAQAAGRNSGKAYVFPSPNSRDPELGSALSDMTLTAVLRRLKLEAVPHGFRSTFRDWCAEQTDYPNEVAEMALAHTVGNKVEAAYRRGDLLAKRQQLMQDWADYALGRRAGNMTVGHGSGPLASTRANTADQHHNTEGAMQ